MANINEKIVLVGGGGGVYRVARFLKNVRENIATIQTMFDHGGHSGRLRDEYGVLPPGDIRQAMLALADESTEMPLRELLSYIFPVKGSSIDDATLGNLIFTAFNDIYDGPLPAIEVMSRIFHVKGKVLPVSLDRAELVVELEDGTSIEGEGNIDTRSFEDDRKIVRAYLRPEANIYTGAYDALIEADKIVFCPGDLYTSIIPNILVSGFSEAIKKSKGKIIYITNIMTKKSETHNFSASDFSKMILTYLGIEKFDYVICNNDPILEKFQVLYGKEESKPVQIDEAELSKYATTVICDRVADQTDGVLRHNQKIASIIAKL